MKQVRAKKYLGQHFLTDETIAQNIVNNLKEKNNVLEIGAGMGVLTKYLLDNDIKNFKVVEIDTESVAYLKENYPALQTKIIEDDFLKINFNDTFSERCAIIGNFPYNISNQILFKVFENRDNVSEVVGMFQKEVAQRIVAKNGNKTYGILSVFLSAFYNISYLFTVDKSVFYPIPKVQSAVIRLERNEVKSLPCDENSFVLVVKTAFNQRRKMLRQSLKALNKDLSMVDKELLTLRAEQLSVDDFINLTNTIYNV
ncbi:MAG: 16S rRNA (adenine(1518)-N(6)/adenine(1519)-N(6))-dimethyltransferase RsmA [Bacteroidales bacterium]|jgi:16S rRNA (adenine1518-N6/adenine1519-N6)-dimethyltransferase|nr:16S rRNA (adenine(1518)-N(6)/adenine(1519)-N(6))-dimethyltransferase RsmA [Bacteroidales bacterium]